MSHPRAEQAMACSPPVVVTSPRPSSASTAAVDESAASCCRPYCASARSPLPLPSAPLSFRQHPAVAVATALATAAAVSMRLVMAPSRQCCTNPGEEPLAINSPSPPPFPLSSLAFLPRRSTAAAHRRCLPLHCPALPVLRRLPLSHCTTREELPQASFPSNEAAFHFPADAVNAFALSPPSPSTAPRNRSAPLRRPPRRRRG